jgi:hypothetical protein
VRVRILASGFLSFKAAVLSVSDLSVPIVCTTCLFLSRPQGNQKGRGTYVLLHPFQDCIFWI